MTDNTPSKDGPFAMDEPPAHRTVAGRADIGKTTRLTTVIAAPHTESDPKWTDPKANDEDATDGGES